MSETCPTSTYPLSPPQRRLPLPWQAMAAVPALVAGPMTMCVCGHMDELSLWFTSAAAGLSWWGFARRGTPPLWRAVIIVLVVLATLVLTKNVADILWFGHDPLLGRRGGWMTGGSAKDES